jgi:hypothetical protein
VSDNSSSQDKGPDVTEDPRQQGTGQGYPESNPESSTPVEGTERGPEAGPKNTGEPDAPASKADEAPSGATGNPGAAGG